MPLELERRRHEKYLMAKDVNLVGPFVSLKVIDAKGRNFSIFVPRGRNYEGGWRETVGLLRELRVQTRMDDQKGREMDLGKRRGR